MKLNELKAQHALNPSLRIKDEKQRTRNIKVGSKKIKTTKAGLLTFVRSENLKDLNIPLLHGFEQGYIEKLSEVLDVETDKLVYIDGSNDMETLYFFIVQHEIYTVFIGKGAQREISFISSKGMESTNKGTPFSVLKRIGAITAFAVKNSPNDIFKFSGFIETSDRLHGINRRLHIYYQMLKNAGVDNIYLADDNIYFSLERKIDLTNGFKLTDSYFDSKKQRVATPKQIQHLKNLAKEHGDTSHIENVMSMDDFNDRVKYYESGQYEVDKKQREDLVKEIKSQKESKIELFNLNRDKIDEIKTIVKENIQNLPIDKPQFNFLPRIRLTKSQSDFIKNYGLDHRDLSKIIRENFKDKMKEGLFYKEDPSFLKDKIIYDYAKQTTKFNAHETIVSILEKENKEEFLDLYKELVNEINAHLNFMFNTISVTAFAFRYVDQKVVFNYLQKNFKNKAG